MIWGRPAWLVCLLLAAMLAGCTGAPADDGPVVITDPEDFSYLENETASDRAHVHDYWGGQDRLVIAEDMFYCGSNLLSDPVICDYRPAAPIPLGTGLVEVTIDWTEDAAQVSHYQDTELWVKTAADTHSQPVQAVAPGETVSLEVTNDQDDLPHQRLSAWEFDLYVWGDRDAPYPLTFKRFYAEVTITIVAHRTLDIPPFPGHPDIWQNRTEIPLVTAYRYPESDGHAVDGDEIRTPPAKTAADDRRIRPDEGVIVPADASYIEVVMEQEYEAVSDRAYLQYHGAADREFLDVEPIEDDGFRQVYHIPVEGDNDSPYALQSMWEFYTFFDNGGDDPVGGDFYKGHYTVSATLYKDPGP